MALSEVLILTCSSSRDSSVQLDFVDQQDTGGKLGYNGQFCKMQKILVFLHTFSFTL